MSTSGWPARPSISPLTTRRRSGTMPSTRPGVCGGPKWRFTLRRSRACSGGAGPVNAGGNPGGARPRTPRWVLAGAGGGAARVGTDPRVVQQVDDLLVGGDDVAAVVLPGH